jgi:hypothetical protein
MMNARGIFCFFILLAFLAIGREIATAGNEVCSAIGGAELTAMKLERANAIRSVIEENVDFIVRESIRESCAEAEGSTVKIAVSRKLAELFSATEEAYNGGADIKFGTRSGAAPDFAFLQENSSAIVVSAWGRRLAAEYCFTGGIAKSEYVSAKIDVEGAETQFILPAGYCQAVEVVV